MKKILLILLLILIPLKVDALCDYQKRASEKRLAANVNFSYDYVEGDKITFNITVSNLFEGLKLEDDKGNIYQYGYNKDNPSEIVLTGYQEGATITFKILSPNSDCNSDLLYTKYVVLPSYNYYYNDPVCSGVTNFSLCQKWVKHDLTREQFIKEVNNFKNKKQEQEKPEEKIEKTILQQIIDFLVNYYYILLAIIGVAIIIVVIINRKRNDVGF